MPAGLPPVAANEVGGDSGVRAEERETGDARSGAVRESSFRISLFGRTVTGRASPSDVSGSWPGPVVDSQPHRFGDAGGGPGPVRPGAWSSLRVWGERGVAGQPRTDRPGGRHRRKLSSHGGG